jgi:hypothetical protein
MFKIQNDKQAVAVLYMGLGVKIVSLLEIQMVIESMYVVILKTIINNLNQCKKELIHGGK